MSDSLAIMSVWARLPVLDCVFGFLGVVEMCGVRGVCGDWKKCEIICPVLRLYYGCSFEKFVKIMDGINLGSVRKIYFHYEQEFDERWLEEIGMRVGMLEELYLRGSFLGEGIDVEGLGECTRLRKLVLECRRAYDEKRTYKSGYIRYGDVVGINKLCNLEELDLDFHDFVGFDDTIFGKLRVLTASKCIGMRGKSNVLGGFKCPKLNVLNLNNDTNDDDLKEILNCLQCVGLRELNVGGCLISDEGVRGIICEGLRYLDLSDCAEVTDRGLEGVGMLKCLERLGLGGTGVTDEGMIWLANLKLEELNLGETSVTDRGLERLRLGVCGDSIKNLGLNDCMGVRGWGIGYFLKLEELDLSGCWNFTSAALLSLRDLKLVKLDLNWVNIGSEELESLPIGLKSLKLRLNDGDFDMDSHWGIRGFIRLKDLRELIIDCCRNIDGVWLAELVRGVVNLEILELGKCTNMICENMELLVGFKNLRALVLRGSDVTNDGLRWVGNMGGLKQLGLFNCEEICDEGIEHLMNLNMLESLSVMNCNIGDDVKVNVKRKLYKKIGSLRHICL